LRKNEIYRVVCQLSDGNTVPSRNTYTTLRSKLSIQGYTALHTNFVKEADKCGLLTPPLHGCPKTMRKGIVLVADSTFILTASFTQGMKAKDGTWLFTDRDAAFGRGHHKHKCPVGYKAHSLITINGIPLVSIMASANEHDTDYIIPLFERLCVRYPSFTFAYLILDKGYESEAIHCAVVRALVTSP